jgi:uncharacterized membrane protein
MLAAYAAALATILVLDALWLGLIARPLYVQGIGHLMAEQTRWAFALAFYLIFALGVVVFVALPTAGSGWSRTLLLGALFGFICYATYDMTNLATLKGWPLGLSALDMAWGAIVAASASSAGRWAWERLQPATT